MVSVVSTGTSYRIMEPSESWKRLEIILESFKKRYPETDIHVELDDNTFGANISSVYFFNGQKLELRLSGKGISPEQAKVSGVMELIERYPWIHPDESKIIHEDYENIADKVLNIRHVFCYTCKNRKDSCENDYLKKCRQWVKCFSLVNGEEFFVPMERVFLMKDVSDVVKKVESNCIPAVWSTGLASGNEINEAIMHGLFEVIERAELYPLYYACGLIDSMSDVRVASNSQKLGIPLTCLYYFRYEWPELRKYPAIDLSKFELSKHLDKEFIDKISVYMISKNFHGLKVYTMLAELENEKILHTKSGPMKFPYLRGSGTHLDPSIAIARAITELIQVGSGNIDINTARKKSPEELVSDLKNYSKGDIELDMKECVDSLSKAGLDIVVSDLTEKSMGVPVVRVMVPGIKHI